MPDSDKRKVGKKVLVSWDRKGTVRNSRTVAFSSFFAAVERMRVEGNDPAADPPLERPRRGPPPHKVNPVE